MCHLKTKYGFNTAFKGGLLDGFVCFPKRGDNLSLSDRYSCMYVYNSQTAEELHFCIPVSYPQRKAILFYPSSHIYKAFSEKMHTTDVLPMAH